MYSVIRKVIALRNDRVRKVGVTVRPRRTFRQDRIFQSGSPVEAYDAAAQIRGVTGKRAVTNNGRGLSVVDATATRAAAANTRCRVAGDSAVDDGQRPENLIDAATVIEGGVARYSAIGDHHCSAKSAVIDAAAGPAIGPQGGIVGDSAVRESERPVVVVYTAPYRGGIPGNGGAGEGQQRAGLGADAASENARGVAGNDAVAEGQRSAVAVVDAAAGVGRVVAGNDAVRQCQVSAVENAAAGVVGSTVPDGQSRYDHGCGTKVSDSKDPRIISANCQIGSTGSANCQIFPNGKRTAG